MSARNEQDKALPFAPRTRALRVQDYDALFSCSDLRGPNEASDNCWTPSNRGRSSSFSRHNGRVSVITAAAGPPPPAGGWGKSGLLPADLDPSCSHVCKRCDTEAMSFGLCG